MAHPKTESTVLTIRVPVDLENRLAREARAPGAIAGEIGACDAAQIDAIDDALRAWLALETGVRRRDL